MHCVYRTFTIKRDHPYWTNIARHLGRELWSFLKRKFKVLCQCSVSQFSLANKFPFQKIILVIKHNGALARSQVSCKNCKSHLFLHEECLWLLLPHLHWHNAVINMAPALSTLLLHKRSVGTRKCNSIQILSIKLIGKCNIYYRINLENKWQGS